MGIEKVSEFLIFELGMSPHLLGFNLLAFTINDITDGKTVVQKRITKDIYPRICEMYNMPASNIDRNIRVCIDKYMHDTNLTPRAIEIRQSIFKNIERVRVSTFVYIIANYISLNYDYISNKDFVLKL